MFSTLFNTLLFVHFVVAILLVFGIILQKPVSDEISGISSGGRGVNFASVHGTNRALRKIVSLLALVFFVNAIVLANISTPKQSIKSKIENVPEQKNTVPIQ